MSRRMGYGRATGDLAAQQIVARLRAAGCTQIVIDRGAGGDPRPEWHKLVDSLRSGDILVLATLPYDRLRQDQVRDQLLTLARDRAIKIMVLLGAPQRHRDFIPLSIRPSVSAGQVGAKLHRLGASGYRRTTPLPPARESLSGS